MAAPTQAYTHAARTLAILGVVVAALGVWTFWPGLTNTPKLGLDLKGGTQVILTPTGSTTGGTITDDQLNQTVEIIRQPVDGFCDDVAILGRMQRDRDADLRRKIA